MKILEEAVLIARCPKHGLHGQRDRCFECGGPVEQVPMVPLSNLEKQRWLTTSTDPVDHPPHYNAHPSGVECIDIVEHMGFNVGNAIKYLWRADEKGAPLEDLKKAQWYIAREIQRREGAAS